MGARFPKTVGRYRLVELQSQGQMGDVFRAEHAELGTPATVRLLTEKAGEDPHLTQLFELTIRLRHPHILGGLDCGRTDDGRPYLVTEELPSAILPVPHENPRQVLRQLGEAVHYAHQQGAVHGDLRPKTIRVTSKNVLKIIDFGMNLAVDYDKVTMAGSQMPNPTYLAPEVFSHQSNEPVVDQYALGALAFHLLTGRPPYEGNRMQIIMAKLKGPAPQADLPQREALARMMATDPAQRFPDVQQAMEALLGAGP